MLKHTHSYTHKHTHGIPIKLVGSVQNAKDTRMISGVHISFGMNVCQRFCDCTSVHMCVFILSPLSQLADFGTRAHTVNNIPGPKHNYWWLCVLRVEREKVRVYFTANFRMRLSTRRDLLSRDNSVASTYMPAIVRNCDLHPHWLLRSIIKSHAHIACWLVSVRVLISVYSRIGFALCLKERVRPCCHHEHYLAKSRARTLITNTQHGIV